MKKEEMVFSKRISNTLESFKIESFIQSIKDVLKESDYQMVYGLIKVSVDSIGYQICIESKDGTIFQVGDWDLFLGEDLDIKIQKKLFHWKELVNSESYPLFYGVKYIRTFQFNPEKVNISKWEESIDDDYNCKRMELMLPRKMKPSDIFRKKKSYRPSEEYIGIPRKTEIYSLTETELQPYVERISKMIKRYKTPDMGDMYLYFQWCSEKELDRKLYEIGVFYFDSQHRIKHIFNKENVFTLKKSYLFDFVEGLNNLFYSEIKKYHDLSTDNEYAFEIVVRITDDNYFIEKFNTSPIKLMDYPNRQRNWLKEEFEDISHLPIQYHMKSLLDKPVVPFKKNISKNFLVKNIPNVRYSRYEDNHVKVLTNREVRQYKRYLKRELKEKVEPFMMTNTGNIFFYSPRFNNIEIFFVREGITRIIFQATKDNLQYFAMGYLSEINIIFFVFNSDLFDKHLTEEKTLFAPFEAFEIKEKYEAIPMKDAFKNLIIEE